MISGRCARQAYCNNQGVLYNGQCYCDQYYTGQNCTQVQCVNGGTYNPSSMKCNCPLGFEGYACQYQTCPVPSNTTFSWYGKTFMIIVEKTQQNQQALNSLSANIAYILGSMNNSAWFTNFVVLTFDCKFT